MRISTDSFVLLNRFLIASSPFLKGDYMDSEEKKIVGMEVKIPDCVDKTIENLTSPLSKSVGTTLADLWYLVFGSVNTFAEKKRIVQAKSLEDFKSNLEKRIETIPEDKRIMPDTQIVGGALYDSRFCVDKDELRNMFENLIASSLNSDTALDVHPSFSGIIRQMTCKDAQTLAKFKSKPRLPIVNYVYVLASDAGTVPAFQNIISVDTAYNCQKESVSLECLQSFGLITINFSRHFSDSTMYDALISSPLFLTTQAAVKNQLETHPTAIDLTYQKGIAFLTDLGRCFLSVCMP